jgi:hypothetical protein
MPHFDIDFFLAIAATGTVILAGYFNTFAPRAKGVSFTFIVIGALIAGYTSYSSGGTSAQAMHDLEKLNEPLTNISATYDVVLPINDRRLSLFTARVRAIVSNTQRQAHYIYYKIQLSDILKTMPTSDPGYKMLRNMGLAIEIYQTPYPPRARWGATIPTLRHPDFYMGVTALGLYSADLPKDATAAIRIGCIYGGTKQLENCKCNSYWSKGTNAYIGQNG